MIMGLIMRYSQQRAIKSAELVADSQKFVVHQVPCHFIDSRPTIVSLLLRNFQDMYTYHSTNVSPQCRATKIEADREISRRKVRKLWENNSENTNADAHMRAFVCLTKMHTKKRHGP